MATQERVKPGDLITSEFINGMLDRLDKLETEIVKSAPVNKMVINFPFPAIQQHLGDELHITGKGFGVPISNSVIIDGVSQTVLAGGSDSELIVKIQNIQNVGLGKPVTLAVSNPQGGAASTQFMLLPFVQTTPTGTLNPHMTLAPADLKILGRAQPYQFIFTVQAITNLDEDYTVQATVDQPGWTAQAVDAGSNPLTQISIPKSDPPNGSETQVRVNVGVPLAAANGTVGRVKLKVTSKKNAAGLSNEGETDVTVNAVPPPPQNKVVVSFTKTFEGNASLNGETVEITKGGGDVTLFCTALVKQDGKHVTTLSFDNPTGWTSKIVGPFTASQSSEQSPTPHDVDVTISAAGNAVATNVNVKVALESDPNNIFGTKSISIKGK